MLETGQGRRKLRSRSWFDNPSNPDMTALYIEKYLNCGLSLEELQSDRPIIGMRRPAAISRHAIVPTASHIARPKSIRSSA